MPPEVSNCCYCGLLCGSTIDIGNCSRRKRIGEQQPVRQAFSIASVSDAILSFAKSPNPLIWVDSADVGSMREIVRFAEACEASVHVGQTTGTKIQKRVAATEGWFGASLNEAACHADLVVTFGDSLLTDLPQLDTLLRQRNDRQSHWCHLGSQPISSADSNVTIPRSGWYRSLTELLLTEVDPSVALNAQLTELHKLINGCRYGVIVWHADEFLDELEELVLRRLTELTRRVSQRSRLALVCVDSNPGRITAQETMLWATGHTPSTTFRSGVWQHRNDLDSFSLHDFEREFSSILMLRTCCTGTPLPELSCELALLPENELQFAPMAARNAVAIAAVGEQVPGLLFRGDHALVLNCDVDCEDTAGHVPTIQALLTDAVQRISPPSDQEHLL